MTTPDPPPASSADQADTVEAPANIRTGRSRARGLWFFISCVAAAIAGDLFAENFHRILSRAIPAVVAMSTVLGFVIVAVVCFLFWRQYRQGGRLATWPAIFLSLGALAGLQWSTRGLNRLIEEISGRFDASTERAEVRPEQPVVPLVLWTFAEFAAYLAASGWFFGIEETLSRPRTENQVATAKGSKTLKPKTTKEHIENGKTVRGLVLFVSCPTTVPEISDGRITFFDDFGTKIPVPVGDLVSARVEISRTKNNGSRRHNWEQLLRALEDLKIDDLKRVWLVGSKDACGNLPDKNAGASIREHEGYGSFRFLPLCETFLKLYIPNVAFKQMPENDGVKFENFDDLIEVVEQCLTDAGVSGITPEQTVVDITGGTKIASIVGATLTLADKTLIQYEPTHGGDPLIYDVRVGAPLAPR